MIPFRYVLVEDPLDNVTCWTTAVEKHRHRQFWERARLSEKKRALYPSLLVSYRNTYAHLQRSGSLSSSFSPQVQGLHHLLVDAAVPPSVKGKPPKIWDHRTPSKSRQVLPERQQKVRPFCVASTNFSKIRVKLEIIFPDENQKIEKHLQGRHTHQRKQERIWPSCSSKCTTLHLP